MARRPTREWLEALVSGALLSGCAASAPQPTPAPTPLQPTPTANVAPATSATPAASITEAAEPGPAAPTAPPQDAVTLSAFDPASCKGPVAARKADPVCIEPKPEPEADEDDHSSSPLDLANVRAGCAIDGIVVLQDTGPRARRGQNIPAEVVEAARSGQPCPETDKDACEKRVKNVALPNVGGIADGDRRYFLVVAQGGELKLVSTREQLAGLIGEVDSKQDAAAFLWLEGWGGSCAKLQAQGKGFVLPQLKVGMRCPAMHRAMRAGAELISDIPEGYDKDGKYRLEVDHSGKVRVKYLGGANTENFGRACGRRPSDLALGCEHAADCGDERSQVGAYLAEGARLEAAAVFAFELMARELAAYAAPASLVERCLAAAADERRHTELTCDAARRYGFEPILPEAHVRPLPSLWQLALENTVEGCVRETWGALSAAVQARTARDPQLAELYAAIAPDELSHAELSWDIHAWLSTQTGAAPTLQALAEVARAELLAEQIDPSPSVAALAGAPARHVACKLIRQLAA
jgi:hypothetical protein